MTESTIIIGGVVFFIEVDLTSEPAKLSLTEACDPSRLDEDDDGMHMHRTLDFEEILA